MIWLYHAPLHYLLYSVNSRAIQILHKILYAFASFLFTFCFLLYAWRCFIFQQSDAALNTRVGLLEREYECASPLFAVDRGAMTFVITNNIDKDLNAEFIRKCFECHFAKFSSYKNCTENNSKRRDSRNHFGLGMGLYVAFNIIKMLGKF